MTKANFKKNQLSETVSDILDGDINYTDDATLSNYNWDDLNKLREELGQSIMTFVSGVSDVITNKDIVDNLGPDVSSFNKAVNTFFSDVNDFSNKVGKLRVTHESRSGIISNPSEFDEYNRVAIQYHSLFNELSVLVTPSITEIMLISVDAQNRIKDNATDVVKGDSDE